MFQGGPQDGGWGWGQGAHPFSQRLASHLTRTVSLTKEESRFGSDFRRKLWRVCRLITKLSCEGVSALHKSVAPWLGKSVLWFHSGMKVECYRTASQVGQDLGRHRASPTLGTWGHTFSGNTGFLTLLLLLFIRKKMISFLFHILSFALRPPFWDLCCCCGCCCCCCCLTAFCSPPVYCSSSLCSTFSDLSVKSAPASPFSAN